MKISSGFALEKHGGMPKFLSYDAITSVLLAELQFSVKNNPNL